MKDVSAEKANKTAPQPGQSAEHYAEQTALDRHYGKIGISAVAAAARYASGAGAGGGAQEFSRQKSES
jgi:hypothetical protein